MDNHVINFELFAQKIDKDVTFIGEVKITTVNYLRGFFKKKNACCVVPN